MGRFHTLHRPSPSTLENTLISTSINAHAAIQTSTTHAHPNTNTHPSPHAPQLGSLPRLPQPEPSPPPRGHPDWRRTVGSNHQSAKRHTRTHNTAMAHTTYSQAITHINTSCAATTATARLNAPHEHRISQSPCTPNKHSKHTHAHKAAHACCDPKHQPPTHTRAPTPTQVLTHRRLVQRRPCPNQSPHHLNVTIVTGGVQWGQTISLPNHTHRHTAQ